MHHAHSTLTPKRVSWCMSIKVVSTLGSYLIPEAAAILKCLDIEHYIVAYNWDELGRNGIERIAAKTGGWVYYLLLRLHPLRNGSESYGICIAGVVCLRPWLRSPSNYIIMNK